jgi:hypothetical protein
MNESKDAKAFGLTFAAKRIGVSPAFLCGEVRAGKLAAVRLGSRVVIFEPDLRYYLEARAANPIAPPTIEL